MDSLQGLQISGCGDEKDRDPPKARGGPSFREGQGFESPQLHQHDEEPAGRRDLRVLAISATRIAGLTSLVFAGTARGLAPTYPRPLCCLTGAAVGPRFGSLRRSNPARSVHGRISVGSSEDRGTFVPVTGFRTMIFSRTHQAKQLDRLARSGQPIVR